MTPAHTAVLRTLRSLLHDLPDIAIRIGPLDAGLGHVHFPTNTITIDPRVTEDQFVCALEWGMVHLRCGSRQPNPALREKTVLEETARRLVPPSGLPPDSDPHTVASTYGVDISVARQAIELAREGRAEGAA